MGQSQDTYRRDAKSLDLDPDAPVRMRYQPVGRFVPHLRQSLPALYASGLPTGPEARPATPDLDAVLRDDILPALLRTEVRQVAVARTDDATEREAAGQAVDDVPPEFRRVLVHALELFKDPTTGTYDPGAVRTLNQRLYHWLSVKGSEGHWTPARVKTVMRYLRLAVDEHGRPRPFVAQLVRRHLPLLQWAEQRWGARLFPTERGDAAEWTDYVSSADGLPVERTHGHRLQQISLAVAQLPQSPGQQLAGPVEVCWRARLCVLQPSQWWALMLRCEVFAEEIDRSTDIGWDDLTFSGRPLPQTAVLRRMFGRHVMPPALFPKHIEDLMPDQWKRASSRVLFVLSHVLAVLEDCETLREAVARAESNASRLHRGAQFVEVLSPHLAGRTRPVTEADWAAHVHSSKLLYPFAWEPPFLAYVQCCKMSLSTPHFAPQLALFADWAVLPLMANRAPHPQCTPERVLPLIRADFERCREWDDDVRWQRSAPLVHVPPQHDTPTLFNGLRRDDMYNLTPSKARTHERIYHNFVGLEEFVPDVAKR